MNKSSSKLLICIFGFGLSLITVINFDFSITILFGLLITISVIIIWWFFVQARVDLFSPNIAFPLAYSAYFLGGATGFLGLFRTPETVSSNLILLISSAGLLSYFAGQLLARGFRLRFGSLSIQGKNIKFRAIILIILGIFSIIFALFYYGSIPLFNVTSRHSVSAYFTYLAYCILVGVVLISPYELRNGKPLRVVKVTIYHLFAIGLLLLLAFRTPIIILSITLVIYLYYIYKANYLSLTVILLLMLIFAVVFARYRFVQRYGEEVLLQFVASSGLPDSKWSTTLGMLYLGFFRTSVDSLSHVITQVPSQYDFYYGQASLASFWSILPGKQLSTRELIGVLVTNINPPPTSYTATILGSPYMDFGLGGIVSFMLMIGFIMRSLYDCIRSQSPYHLTIFSLVSAIFIASIHTGLTDPIFILFIPSLVLLVYKVKVFRIRFSSEVRVIKN